jgi:hypothetical protein
VPLLRCSSDLRWRTMLLLLLLLLLSGQRSSQVSAISC